MTEMTESTLTTAIARPHERAVLVAGASSSGRGIVQSASARARLERAAAWLAGRGASEAVLIVGATNEGANHIARRAARPLGATFGWERCTLGRLAGALATPELASRGLATAGRLALEALCARIVDREEPTSRGLGRFAPIADRPGLPRALATTMEELRLAALDPEALADPDLAGLLAAYTDELARTGLADRAEVLAIACRVARDPATKNAWLGLPTLFVDVPLRHARERDLVAAIAARAPGVFATVPAGDERSALHFGRALGEGAVAVASDAPGGLCRLQDGLFSFGTQLPGSAAEVEIFSAPGESRECVEIGRRVLAQAERGVPFDRMAIVVRSPPQYRPHLVEALRRAKIPAHFARGTVRPDPSGRAFLALLRCAAEQLSASRFAEYLSLGEVPDATAAGAPPPPSPAAERWIPPDEEVMHPAIERASIAGDDDEIAPPSREPDPESAAVVAGTLRAPYRWERALVDAAVIGGIERWRTRLAGRRRELVLELEALREPDGPMAPRLAKEIADLDALAAYALPLLDELLALPAQAPWGVWLDRLGALATRALRRPDRVLAVLAELDPMSAVDEVDLREVRLVLERRLTDLVDRPAARRYGRVYVASVDEVRGLEFDVVFVPGLAEKVFPQKVTEDPILPDRLRKAIDDGLATNHERAAAERLGLRLAVGAATSRVVLSYPRVDTDQSRPRTPSFYGLEVLRAAEGRLPGFDELARRADAIGGARLGWPAPARAIDAIDEAEHDLALLETILKRAEGETVGTARYLLSANPYLARALRARAMRWQPKWSGADGLMRPAGEARAALDAHRLGARSYSPTALQHFAACPYRFVLQALHRLAPREEPVAIDELDPLQRGSLIHDVQFEVYGALRAAGLLPVTPSNLDEARAILERVTVAVAARYERDLAPAILRVWEDGIQSIKADLREMLRRDAADPDWVPLHFELSFGPLPSRNGKDPRSQDDPVRLDNGLTVRGSIDLVERDARGALRATDYKTGKVRAKEGDRIGGGQTLQPVLYALVLEKLFPGVRVEGGRLYYCTATGDFTEVPFRLQDMRGDADAVVKIVGQALENGFLPAAPDKGGCTYCDYRPVCGPYEELRTKRVKIQEPLSELVRLRGRR